MVPALAGTALFVGCLVCLNDLNIATSEIEILA